MPAPECEARTTGLGNPGVDEVHREGERRRWWGVSSCHGAGGRVWLEPRPVNPKAPPPPPVPPAEGTMTNVQGVSIGGGVRKPDTVAVPLAPKLCTYVHPLGRVAAKACKR